MPKQSVKEMGEWVRSSDINLYLNGQYIKGLKELYLNDGAIYVVKVAFTPNKENMELLNLEELKIKISYGKKTILDGLVSVADVDLIMENEYLVVELETVLIDEQN